MYIVMPLSIVFKKYSIYFGQVSFFWMSVKNKLEMIDGGTNSKLSEGNGKFSSEVGCFG